jgi:hypothetical protein
MTTNTRRPDLSVAFSYAAVVALVVVWEIAAARKGIPVVTTSRENALEAIGLLKDWSVWLTGIETAAIAAVGALLKDSKRPRRAWLIQACVTAFVLSLVAATWLLGTLPRIAILLSATDATTNDVIAHVVPFYLVPPYVVIPVRLGLMVVFEHLFFLVGISLGCWLLLDVRGAARAQKEPGA